MSNSDLFARMMGATFNVEIERDGEKQYIECRDLPFTTLMAIVGEFATSAQTEIIKARRRIVEDISTLGLQNFNAKELTDMFTPILTAALFQMPRLSERFLLDVVVDAKPEHIKLLTVEDTLIIVDSVIARVNVERVAEKTRSVFFRASSISTKVIELQGAQEAAKRPKTVARKSQ